MLSEEEQELLEAIKTLQDIDLRSIRRETKIDHIAQFVPRPCNPLPYNPLPRWVNLPLTHKLPIVPSPPGMFHLSRNTVGDSLFHCNPGCHFDNDDPHLRRTPVGYDSLNDPNLRDYFNQHPKLLKSLERNGLINESGNVSCTVKEFNKYRDYLARLYSKDVQQEKDKWVQWDTENIKQVKKIRLATIREAGAEKEDRAKKRLDKYRAAKERKQILTQLKEFFHPSCVPKKELSQERQLLMQQQEARRLQKDLRIAKMRMAEETRRKELVMQWYCRDMYIHGFRKSLRDFHRKRKLCDLQSFIRYKREYQTQKLRYERAINLRYKAERQCGVSRRAKHFGNLELHRQEIIKMKEVQREKQKEREMYLKRKYGRRWLALTAEKHRNEQTFHDSLWHIRYDLRQMVNLLREESGAVNFSNFIKDLVKLAKPRREEIKMSEETKTAVDYVLGIILDNAFKEFIRKKTSCALNFLSEEVRKKLTVGVCQPQEVIPLDDFIPPELRKRFVPQYPFERPPWPCSGPCAKYASKQTRGDKKWKRKCMEMAHAMNVVHDQISTYLTDKMFRNQQEKACANQSEPCELPCIQGLNKCSVRDNTKSGKRSKAASAKPKRGDETVIDDQRSPSEDVGETTDMATAKEGPSTSTSDDKNRLNLKPGNKNAKKEQRRPSDHQKVGLDDIDKVPDVAAPQEGPDGSIGDELPLEDVGGEAGVAAPQEGPATSVSGDDLDLRWVDEIVDEERRKESMLQKIGVADDDQAADVSVPQEEPSTSIPAADLNLKGVDEIVIEDQRPSDHQKVGLDDVKKVAEVAAPQAGPSTSIPKDDLHSKSVDQTVINDRKPSDHQKVGLDDVQKVADVADPQKKPDKSIPEDETDVNLQSVDQTPVKDQRTPRDIQKLTSTGVNKVADVAARQQEGPTTSVSEDDLDLRWVDEIVKEERRVLSDLQKRRLEDTEAVANVAPQEGPSTSIPAADLNLKGVDEIAKKERKPSDHQKVGLEDVDKVADAAAPQEGPDASIKDELPLEDVGEESGVAAPQEVPTTSIPAVDLNLKGVDEIAIEDRRPSDHQKVGLDDDVKKVAEVAAPQAGPSTSIPKGDLHSKSVDQIVINDRKPSDHQKVGLKDVDKVADAATPQKEPDASIKDKLPLEDVGEDAGVAAPQKKPDASIKDDFPVEDMGEKADVAAPQAEPTKSIPEDEDAFDSKSVDKIAVEDQTPSDLQKLPLADVNEDAGLADPQKGPTTSIPEDNLDLRWVDEIVKEERRVLSDLQKRRLEDTEAVANVAPQEEPVASIKDELPLKDVGEKAGVAAPQEEPTTSIPKDDLDLKAVDEIAKKEQRRPSDQQKVGLEDVDKVADVPAPQEGPDASIKDELPLKDVGEEAGVAAPQEPSTSISEDNLDLRWVDEIVKEERRVLSDLQKRRLEDTEAVANVPLQEGPTTSIPENEGDQNFKWVDEIATKERQVLSDLQKRRLEDTEAVANVPLQDGPTTSVSEDDLDLRWVDEIVKEERRVLSDLQKRTLEDTEAVAYVAPQEKPTTSIPENESDLNLKWVDEIVKGKRQVLSDLQKRRLEDTEAVAVANVAPQEEPTTSIPENEGDLNLKWVEDLVKQERRKLSLLQVRPEGHQGLTEPTSDVTFVSDIIEHERKRLQDESNAIRALRGDGDDSAGGIDDEEDLRWVREIVEGERRKLSLLAVKVNPDAQSSATSAAEFILNPDSEFTSQDSMALDPNEEGISVTRSEIRRQLNLVSGELDAIKEQLIRQGFLPESSSQDQPPGPSRTN